MPKEYSLKPTAILFVKAYSAAVDLEIAAKRAGITPEQGRRLLKRPRIKALIAQEQSKLAEKWNCSPERILAETARLAFSDVTDVVQWEQDGEKLSFTASDKLPPEVRAAISEVSLTTRKDGSQVFKVKMHDKQNPLNLLGQKHGHWGRKQDDGQAAQVNTYLTFIQMVQEGKLDALAAQYGPPIETTARHVAEPAPLPGEPAPLTKPTDIGL